MSRIYKYKVGSGLNQIQVPKGPELLSVKTQYGSPVAYFSVDDTAKHDVEVKIHLSLTGAPTPNGKFIDTLMLDNDNFVLHAFLLE